MTAAFAKDILTGGYPYAFKNYVKFLGCSKVSKSSWVRVFPQERLKRGRFSMHSLKFCVKLLYVNRLYAKCISYSTRN